MCKYVFISFEMDRATFKAVLSNQIRNNCGNKGFATFVTIRDICSEFTIKFHFWTIACLHIKISCRHMWRMAKRLDNTALKFP